MLSRTLTLAAGALLALGLAVPQSSAQTLESISPDNGTRGTVVTITGTGLEKSKVWLTRDGDKKKYSFKVDKKASSDTELKALLKKAVAGEFTMHILPKGGNELTTNFDVLAPSIVNVEPATASPGDEVVITVANGGGVKPKPKIYVGGQKAKVSGVVEQEETFSGGLFTLISAIMPKKIANGTWDVTIDNKVAEEIAEAALEITGSDVSIGKPTLSLKVDGNNAKLFKATIASAFIADRLHITGGTKPNPAKNITLWFQIDLENDTPPFTIEPSFVDTLVYSETDVNAFPPLPATWGLITDDWTITINSISGGQVGGTYQGTLSPDALNPSSETRTVSGDFIAEP